MLNSENNFINKVRFPTKFLLGKAPTFDVNVGLSSPAYHAINVICA